MKVRNRILYVRQNDGEEGKGLFARVLRDLHEALREKTGRARGFVDWPNVNWREGDLHCQVSCWYSDENQDERLVQVKLTEQVGDVTWITEVTIGTVRDDQVIVWEVCETSDRVPIPVDDAPAVLDFLASYSCEDVDGYPTGKVLVVEQHQASSFALFVKALSEDRRLPIILVSPRLYNDEYTLQNVRKLAAQLRGMAHVIRLSDKTKWFGQHLPLKAYTVDGSVRIYLPGYGEDESSRRHRLWSHTHIQKLGLEETADEITQEVYQHNANFSFEDAALAGLLAARDRQIRRRKLESERSAEQARRAQNLAVLHQRIKTQPKAKTNAELEQYIEAFDQENVKLKQELDRLTAENETLLQEQRQLQDTIRQQRFLLSQQWVHVSDYVEDAESGHNLLLAGNVWEDFNGLDNGLRQAVESVLWEKLCDPQLRDSQSEAITSKTGTCFVYPRGGAADGRRVIYMLDDGQVKVCELFMNHDDYEAARDRGFDLTIYEDFVAWEPAQVIETT